MDHFSLEKFYTEPEQKYNLMTTVLFKMKKSYQKFDFYLNKAFFLIKELHNYLPNFYLRIYFDNFFKTFLWLLIFILQPQPRPVANSHPSQSLI